MTRRDVCSDAEAMQVFEQMRNGIHPKWQDCIAGPGQEPKESEWIAPEKWIKRAFAGWAVCLGACPAVWWFFVVHTLGPFGTTLRNIVIYDQKCFALGVEFLGMTLGASLLISWLCRVVPEDKLFKWYLDDRSDLKQWKRKLKWTLWRTFIFRRFSFVSAGMLGVVVFFWRCRNGTDFMDSPWFFPWIWTWVTAFVVSCQNFEEVAVVAAPPEPQPFGEASAAKAEERAGLL